MECQKKGAEGRRGALGGPEFRAAEKKKDRFSRITKVPLNFLFSQAAPFQKESPQRGKPRDAERNEKRHLAVEVQGRWDKRCSEKQGKG